MIERFIKKYGIAVMIFLTLCIVIISIFLLGFVCGQNTAPKVEASEARKNVIQCTDSTTRPVKVAEAVKAEATKEIEVIATAYCPCEKCCGEWADGITSTGVTAKAGRTIAVDPSVIPYGTEIEIDGHIYVAEDCGGAIKGNAVDIYFDTHAEALEFGRQTKTAIIPD